MKNNLEQDAIFANFETISMKPAIREGLEKLIHGLTGIRTDFQKGLAGIEADRRFTKHGKQDRRQKLGAETMELLKPFHNAYQEHLAQTKRKLLDGGNGTEKKSDFGKVIDYLRQSELRRMYGVESMDELQIEAKMTDPQFLEAILSSPKPLLSQGKLDELVMKKVENDRPEIGIELEQLTFASNTVQTLVKSLQNDVQASGWKDPAHPLNEEGEPVVDEVRELAGS